MHTGGGEGGKGVEGDKSGVSIQKFYKTYLQKCNKRYALLIKVLQPL